jgi:hypothetical protein
MRWWPVIRYGTLITIPVSSSGQAFSPRRDKKYRDDIKEIGITEDWILAYARMVFIRDRVTVRKKGRTALPPDRRVVQSDFLAMTF